MNEIITIIVPVYNVHNYIIECLDSVVNQTYKGPIECILIDDKGTDNSMEIVKQYVNAYNGHVQFKIISHTCNKGLSAARNTGLDNASGNYIYFLDSDDFINPETLTELYSAITSHKAAIAIGYFTSYNNGVDSVYRNDWIFETTRIIKPSHFLETMLMEKSNFASTAKLYRRGVLENVRFRHGKRNEDTLFAFDLSKTIEACQYICVDVPIYSYHYRIVNGSISHTNSRPLEIDIIDNYDIIMHECIDRKKLVVSIQKKQLQLLMGLVYKIISSKHFSYTDYKKYAKRLSDYAPEIASSCLSELNYRNYKMIIGHMLLYWYIHRTKYILKSWIH